MTLTDYACWAAGAVTVPVYETSSAEEVEWIVRDSAARAAFAETAEHEKIISGVRGGLPGLERLWMIDELDPLASGGAQVSDDQLERRRAGTGAADLATIIYTSGTTGRPKGCQLTHGNLLADVRSAIAALPEIFETPGCSTLLFLPLAHAFGRIIQIGILEAGRGPGALAGLPDSSGRPGRVPSHVLARGAAGVREGLPERPAAGFVQIKGPGVFAGYWRDDAATAEVDGGDGWLRTGDLGELDEEGFLRVTGREKDLIITAGGTNVAPAVLENRIRAHPLVSQVMVIGDARPYVACLVTLDAEALQAWKWQHGRPAGASSGDLAGDAQLIAEIQRVVDDANKAVSRAGSIRRFAILTTDFTEGSGQLTPSDKVRRHIVARDFAAEIEALYSQPPAGG